METGRNGSELARETWAIPGWQIDLAPEETFLTSAPPLTYQANAGFETSEGSNGQAGPPTAARDYETTLRAGIVSYLRHNTGYHSAHCLTVQLTSQTSRQGDM